MAIRALAVLSIVAICFTTASAQTPPGDQAPQERENQTRQKQDQQRNAVRVVHIYRVSVVNGMDVRNPAGENLGHINDLVIDVKSGQVRYAVLSFGGFLGFGDKLFAVPCKELTIKHTNDESYFLLNIDVKRFEQAPGFKSDAWPNVGDPEWAVGIDKFFRANNATEERPADQERPQQPQPNEADAQKKKVVTMYRASDIVGLSVRNPKGEELGDINELVVDVNNCEVRYAAVSFGGFLGIGDKLFAVPFNALHLKIEENRRAFIMDIDRQRLENAPGFDPDNWPNTADPRWGKQIDQFYETQRRAAHRPE